MPCRDGSRDHIRNGWTPPAEPFHAGQVVYPGAYSLREALPIQRPDNRLPPVPGLYLVLHEAKRATVEARRYNPLTDETGLFRIFVNYKPTPDKPMPDRHLDFAQQYGLLWGGQDVRPLKYQSSGRRTRLRSRPPALQRDVLIGEHVQAWDREHRRLREAVALWDDVQSGTRTGEARHEAMEAIQRMYYSVVGPRGTGGVTPMLLWQRGMDRLGHHFVPRNLLSALWVQFAEAVAGDHHFRQCAECGTWWKASPDVARADARYCSNACRQRRYRRRQRKNTNTTTDRGDTP